MLTRRKGTGAAALVLALVAAMALSTVALAQGPGNGTGVLVSGSSLTDNEVAGLLYMVEEEKLARDVYATLYDLWGFAAFDSISASEQRHMDALAKLIELCGLEDPVQEEVGAFSDAGLQELHDELIITGAQSLEDALRVGAAIEEIDILDLEQHASETEQSAILRVYQSLLRGSENHLRAFVRALERETGEAYEPQYMSEDAYEAIIGSSPQRGQGGGLAGRPGRQARQSL
jgi:hypothetical protein